MNPELTGRIGDALIPLIGGALCLLLGFRIVGKKPGVNKEYDVWHAKYGNYFKWGGAFLIIWSFARLLLGF